MKHPMAIFVLIGLLLLSTLSAPPAEAATPTNGVIVRVQALGPFTGQTVIGLVCTLLPCTVVRNLDQGILNQVFLITPNGISAQTLLNDVLGLVGRVLDLLNGLLPVPVGKVVDAELDRTLNLVDISLGDLIAPANLNDTAVVQYYGTSASTGYTTQPAVGIIELAKIHSQDCSSTTCGAGTVADIDTGVDPNQSVLQGVLDQGYDFTRNEAGGWETRDVNNGQPMNVTSPPTSDTQINQQTMAVLNGGGANLLSNPAYSGFGHGTMVSGIIHLVAPTARILPLKTFGSNGQGQLSDVLRAIYYGVQNGANILNMSFDMTTSSTELANALNYASGQGLVSVASVGNNGKKIGSGFEVYPASLSPVMGIASTSNNDTLSSFSNYGAPPTWVGAPGEGIVSTYPYNTYAAGWGTSFSAPFVSGTVALMRGVGGSVNQQKAADATCHAVNIGNSEVGYGRLDAYDAVTALGAGSCP